MILQKSEEKNFDFEQFINTVFNFLTPYYEEIETEEEKENNLFDSKIRLISEKLDEESSDELKNIINKIE